jgi:site-specific DNA-methyltransferase (adenine-specific)
MIRTRDRHWIPRAHIRISAHGNRLRVTWGMKPLRTLVRPAQRLRFQNLDLIRRLEVRLFSMNGRLSIFRADAVEWLQRLPAASVDLVITDPPYESLEKHRAIGTTTRLKQSKASSNPWFQIFPNDRFPQLFSAIFRILKHNSHFYLFSDPETAFIAKPIAESMGFKFWKPLIWDKQTIGMGYHYRARYEMILFFEKGKRRLNDLGIPDVVTAPRIRNGYPAEKPVSVAEILIRQSTRPGELVLDPFMGSGSFGVAALKAGRSFAGSDCSPDALLVAENRLQAAVAAIQAARASEAGVFPQEQPLLS